MHPELRRHGKKIMERFSLQTRCSVLTRFLWCSSKSSFDGATVRVVPTADATFVLHLVGADLSVAANFLKTEKTTTRMKTHD